MSTHHGTDHDHFVFNRNGRRNELPAAHSSDWRRAGMACRSIEVDGYRHDVFDEDGLMSYGAIAAIMAFRGERHLSRERVRKIVDGALLKIREALEEDDGL